MMNQLKAIDHLNIDHITKENQTFHSRIRSKNLLRECFRFSSIRNHHFIHSLLDETRIQIYCK